MTTTPPPDPYGPPTQPIYDHPTPGRRRRWLVPLLCGVGGLILGGAVGASGGGSSPSNTAAPATTSTVTSTVTATASAAAAPATTTTATVTTKATPATVTKTVKVTPAPHASFEDGVYNVGEDIKPGTYRTTAAVDPGAGCYWEIDSSPGSDNIVQNDNVNGGRPTVVLRRGQQFKSDGCGAWGRQ